MYEYEIILEATGYQQWNWLGFEVSDEPKIPCKLMTPLPIPLLEGYDGGPPEVSAWMDTAGGTAFLEVHLRDGKQFRVYNHPFVLVAE